MFNLTSSEKRAILFTVLIISGGGLIQFIRPHINKEYLFDYSVSDSIFIRRSSEKTSQLAPKNHKSVSNGISDGFYIDSNIPNDFTDLETVSININNATHGELQKLPRIGPALAKRIIEYRKNNGQFGTIEDLMNVKGIGKKTLENLKPFLIEIH